MVQPEPEQLSRRRGRGPAFLGLNQRGLHDTQNRLALSFGYLLPIDSKVSYNLSESGHDARVSLLNGTLSCTAPASRLRRPTTRKRLRSEELLTTKVAG
jgi:hypothetical protein